MIGFRPRYRIVAARPATDPLGKQDMLIVDEQIGSVIAIVYSSELAAVAADAFNDADRENDPESDPTS